MVAVQGQIARSAPVSLPCEEAASVVCYWINDNSKRASELGETDYGAHKEAPQVGVSIFLGNILEAHLVFVEPNDRYQVVAEILRVVPEGNKEGALLEAEFSIRMVFAPVGPRP